MEKKKLQEMNLIDDFLFEKMVTYPEVGEEFCKRLIYTVLDVNLNKVRIVPQKVYLGSDSTFHGARLDVYIEEDGEDLNGTLYDVEPDKNKEPLLVAALPKRVRFYHAIMDQECLKSGQDYNNLKRVIIIMIMPYDPFGQDYMMYTFKNHCVEIPELPYDDGAETIFLYTRGTKGNCSQALREFLQYMEHSTSENACNGLLREIHSMVSKVKSDKEVSIEYMKTFEREKMIYNDGVKDGREQGLEQGRELERVYFVCKKMARNYSVSEIADMLEEEPEVIQRIYDVAEAFAPDYDAEQVMEAMKGEKQET